MYKSDVVDELKICLPYNLDHFGDVYFYSKDVEITIHSAGLTIEYIGACGTEINIKYEDIDRMFHDNSSLHFSVSAHPMPEGREVLFIMDITVGIKQEDEDAED